MADESGFTLVEVLVAAMLLALIAMLSGQGLALAGKAWGSVRDHATGDDEVAVAQSLVRRMIVQSRPEMFYQDDGRLARSFAGGADTLRLVADMPPGSARSSALEFRVENGGLAMVLAPITPAESQPLHALAFGKRFVLVSGVASARFAYWGPDGAWLDSWSDFQHPPLLVRLRLTFPPGDPREWPDLVAAPVTEIPVIL